ncbi:hypothetical protein SLS60_002501 [Paraconiothyrium brasiliense]|uniref:BTB domain-containing protein n=1 Tax=Paraconiothyrium brasiliense TaxID=300254 RepID=A0ABR3S2C9_9PLEO
MPSCFSASQRSNLDDALKLEGTEAQTHQQVVSYRAAPPAAMTDPKQHFSLVVLPKTFIVIECGDDLSTQYQVPLSVLCAQSQKQFQIFLQAEDLYRRYGKVKALKKRVKAIHPLLELHKLMHAEKSREKRLTDTTDAMFQKNELFFKAPNKAPNKRFDRSQYPRNDVEGRLGQLRDEAVYTVLERLEVYLHGLKQVEKKNASESAVKAAAQRRIILPNEDPATVEVVVEWLYKNSLSFVDVNHLCKIHTLADKLGVMSLAAECMRLVSTATSRILQQAKSEGITVRGLLLESARAQKQMQDLDVNGDPLSSPCVVGEVFKITLHTQDPPAIMQNLVVDAIADSEDDELFHELLPAMNLDMRGKIGMAMIRNAKSRGAAVANRQPDQSQAYAGASRCASVKSEVSHDKDQH